MPKSIRLLPENCTNSSSRSQFNKLVAYIILEIQVITWKQLTQRNGSVIQGQQSGQMDHHILHLLTSFFGVSLYLKWKNQSKFVNRLRQHITDVFIRISPETFHDAREEFLSLMINCHGVKGNFQQFLSWLLFKIYLFWLLTTFVSYLII